MLSIKKIFTSVDWLSLPIMQDISARTEQLIFENSRIFELAKIASIGRTLRTELNLYIVIKGIVYLYTYDSAGSRRINTLLGSNSIINIEDFLSAETARSLLAPKMELMLYYGTLNAISLLEVPKILISRLQKQDHVLASNIKDSIIARTIADHRRIYTLMLLRIEKKILAILYFLLEEFSGIDSSKVWQSLPFKLEITTLADILAVARESVSRALRKLRAAHLVARQNAYFSIRVEAVIRELFDP